MNEYMIEDDVQGTSISVLSLCLMESWTFINQTMDLKWDEASWALRVGPFRVALLSDKVDTLSVFQTNWVPGDSVIEQTYNLYLNHFFQGTDSLPFLNHPNPFPKFSPSSPPTHSQLQTPELVAL